MLLINYMFVSEVKVVYKFQEGIMSDLIMATLHKKLIISISIFNRLSSRLVNVICHCLVIKGMRFVSVCLIVWEITL
jgi:hypothetical protein